MPFAWVELWPRNAAGRARWTVVLWL